MQTSNRKTGAKGEDMALAYLILNGFVLLERNWRHGRCEIDLIMEEKETIVFVEVKARSTEAFGWPEAAVKKSKQANIIKAAQEYLYLKQPNKELRFEIVSIILKKDEPDIYHIRDAFVG